MVFHKIPHTLQLFAENLMKTLKDGSLHEKLLVLAKLMSNNNNNNNNINDVDNANNNRSFQ